MQKNDIRPVIHHSQRLTQNRSKTSIIPKTIKSKIENIGKKLFNGGFGNDFMTLTPKAQTKEKKQ